MDVLLGAGANAGFTGDAFPAAQADASVLVAAEAISNCVEIPAFSTKSFITNSAIGLRQIFT